MLLGKKRKLGRKIEELSVGETLQLAEKIEDKDLLLYLGLTNDSNPLYIQNDYASQTSFQKPVVPTIMLNGVVTSAISKYIPGPGSYITAQQFDYPQPLYHYDTIHILLEVTKVNIERNEVTVGITGCNDVGELVMQGKVIANPPIGEQHNSASKKDKI
ncbi:enoyl-CoA hydratase [Viridibacillus sp. YIM B01967]|uniref:Enoyl-CoA hydratase n=1 Tax=Viridibacillus soli TaxID=2798301 RepID=A0ABS1H2F3_9BACL|nr:MaoC/PaaZ C-terminal domain-containing protein [Viridibacillus soli]MBK3493571.1 enoyl-CoA hydratase [Viridibacillus soli]